MPLIHEVGKGGSGAGSMITVKSQDVMMINVDKETGLCR